MTVSYTAPHCTPLDPNTTRQVLHWRGALYCTGGVRCIALEGSAGFGVSQPRPTSDPRDPASKMRCRRGADVVPVCSVRYRCGADVVPLSGGIVRYLEAFLDGGSFSCHTTLRLLSGGIVRYLEAFPDGGFFRGKNFVFDHRLAVPPAAPQQATIGTCCLCTRPFDDYSGRNRCAACRMLLLVCPACAQDQPDILSQYSPPHPTTTSPLHSHQHQIPHAASTTCHAGNVPAGSPDEAPGVMIASSVADSLPACTAAPCRQPVGRFPPDQLDGQVYGWATSLSHLRKVVSELGQFDGVLGFSQGAAVAAAVAALASKEREEAHALFSWKEVTVVGGKREQREEGSEKEECPRRQGAVRKQKVWGGIRFAILCSGYVAAKDAHPFMHELMENSEFD
ncbi:unnamed protein product [Closterium sp. Naga37s-1]|nr:unnamed protein product [Closterium sp. Naga37s-1]